MPADRPPPSTALLRAAQEALRTSVAAVPVLKATTTTPTAPQAPPASPPAEVPPALKKDRPSQRPPRPLNPNQISAARLLLAGTSVTETADAIGVNRYTITRWKADPRFQNELRRQASATEARERAKLDRAAPRHMAPHGATFSRHNTPNEPTAAPPVPRYSGATDRAILAGLPRPGNPGRDP
jgi:hypothetical protein